MNEKIKFRTELQRLAECAVLVGLALALSYVKIQLGANGGSVDIVMVPLLILAFRHGAGWGIVSGLVFGFLKCVLVGGIGWGLPAVLLDYVLAYGVVGIAGFFKGKSWFYPLAALIGCFARFIMHFISGVTIWAIVTKTELFGLSIENAAVYSIVYNGSYMLINTALAVALIILLRNPLRKYI